MGVSIGKLALQIGVDILELTSGLIKGGLAIANFAKGAGVKLANIGGDVIGKAGGGDLLGLAKMIPYVGPLVGLLEPLVSVPLQFAANAETARMRLTALYGSAEEANAAFGQLKNLSLATGFGLDQLEPAARNLAQAGVKADYLAATMKSLAQVSAVTGTPIEELSATLARMIETGHVGGKQLHQLGGPVLKQLAANLGVAGTDLRKLAESGTIGPRDVLKALQDVTAESGQLGGALEARAKTMAGSWAIMQEQLKSVVGTFGATIAGGLGEGFAGGAGGDFTAFIAEVKSGIESLRPAFVWIGEFARTRIEMIRAAWYDFVLPAIEAVKDWLASLGGSFMSASDIATAQEHYIALGLGYVVDSLKIAGGAVLTYLASPFLRASEFIVDALASVFDLMGPQWGTQLKLMVQLLAFNAAGLSAIFEAIALSAVASWNVIGSAFTTIMVRGVSLQLTQTLNTFRAVMDRIVKALPDKATPQWVKDVRSALDVGDMLADRAAKFVTPEVKINDVRDGFKRFNDEVKAGKDEAVKAIDELLNKHGIADWLKGARDQLKGWNATVKGLGGDLLGINLGDSAKAIDDWFAKLNIRKQGAEGGGIKLGIDAKNLAEGIDAPLKELDRKLSGALEAGSKDAYSAIVKFQTGQGRDVKGAREAADRAKMIDHLGKVALLAGQEVNRLLELNRQQEAARVEIARQVELLRLIAQQKAPQVAQF